MKMQSAAPSLFVGLSSADRDALGEDYMAKISWERAENPWRDKPLNCTENFSRNWSLKQLVLNGSIFCAMFWSATHRRVRMPQNIYSAIFWKLFKKPFTPVPFFFLVDNFRPLRGNLLGQCDFLNMGLALTPTFFEQS